MDISLKIAARATYLANPGACKHPNPQRYIDGIERTMKLERSLEANTLQAFGQHPVDIALALLPAHKNPVLNAARDLGIPIPEPPPPRPSCDLCDNTGWITDDPEQRTVTPCPDCTRAQGVS